MKEGDGFLHAEFGLGYAYMNLSDISKLIEPMHLFVINPEISFGYDWTYANGFTIGLGIGIGYRYYLPQKISGVINLAGGLWVGYVF